jgi:hypothetical protein
MGKKPKAVAPPKVNYGADIRAGLTAYQQSLPSILAFEQQYRPQFTQLNQQQIDLARSLELASMGRNVGTVRGLLQSLSPEQAREVEAAGGLAQRAREMQAGYQDAATPEAQAALARQKQATQQYSGLSALQTQAAQEAYGRSGRLTPEQLRSSQQAAREASAASGRIGGNAAISAEVMNREQALAQRRAEAAQYGGIAQQGMAGLAGLETGTAGLAQDIENQRLARQSGLLSQASSLGTQAYNLGQNFYSPGLGLLGGTPVSAQQVGPQLFSPDAFLNLGAANRQNILSADAATQQARASYSSGLFSGLGALGGGIASGAGSAGGIMGLIKSDRRVKQNIKVVGRTDSGLPVYTYQYKGQNVTQMGVMAQDVEMVNPEAVVEINGIKHVDYNRI